MVTTALREKMRAILRARNYSPRTEETYVAAVIHFASHFGTPPDQLGPEHVIAYQVWMRDQKHASHVLFNQTVCALRFFYGEVLNRPDVVERIRYARRERRLPVVLSVEETIELLSSIDHPRYRILLTTIYATGLRLSEALALRVADIDSKRMVVRVRQGKGKKDRYVPLPSALLDLLREHWRREHLRDLLFPHSSDPSRPADPTGVQRYLQRMMAKSGWAKKVTPRTLRHCYATHLIEQGTSTRVVQVLLGHSNVHTTETYTHVSPSTLGNVTGPLDRVLKAATKSSHE
ncbi:MAG TPA: site-specific integrase [Thermoanaerobaculia bacterium]|jgi:site-specific recombinase XerD|nr:site-specific integrase [Thermoanaerobaculia bacterium]